MMYQAADRYKKKVAVRQFICLMGDGNALTNDAGEAEISKRVEGGTQSPS